MEEATEYFTQVIKEKKTILLNKMEIQIPRSFVRRKKRFDENYGLCVSLYSIEMAANCNCTWPFCFVQDECILNVCYMCIDYEKILNTFNATFYSTHTGLPVALANEESQNSSGDNLYSTYAGLQPGVKISGNAL